MSEHVLCMVLYLIELGLDNQVQESKEDEVWATAFLLITGASCTVSDEVSSLLGALHRGALPRQLVPRNQSPLQPAPCHQLCQSAGSRDGARGEEGGSAQHQHRGLILRPGKQHCTAASIHHSSRSNGVTSLEQEQGGAFFDTTSSGSFLRFPARAKKREKTMQVFQVRRQYSGELQGRCFLPHLLPCLFCPPAANGPAR